MAWVITVQSEERVGITYSPVDSQYIYLDLSIQQSAYELRRFFILYLFTGLDFYFGVSDESK